MIVESRGERSEGLYDVAVIGGGVVGCAVARRFTLEGARVVLLEKAPDILAGASKGNSAILHTGFDAPEGSLELACMQAGYTEYRAIHESLNLPLLTTGAIVAAWNEHDEAELDAIVARAHANGVDNVRRIDRAEVLAREPQLNPAVRGGVLVPDEHVIDPWSAPLAYLTQAMANGAEVRRDCEVTGGAFDGAAWQLDTSRGRIAAAQVINCAGLYGDVVEQRLLGEAHMQIRPRKGQFVVFDKAAAALVDHILLPVPQPRTKGVVVTRTAYGNVLVGPTAEEQDDREHARVDHDTLEALIAAGAERLPALADMPVTAVYAGLRPATEDKEYRIRHEPARHWLTLGGVRSTGLTAALGIAAHAYALYREYVEHQPLASPVTPWVPNIAEHRPRDWQAAGYGEIVCHCELVTRREIEAALASSLPPGDIGGLKRRTRACMGRCQGFYCGARVAQIAGDALATPLSTGAAHEH
ncbi:FAD-dependent oxidoreductase [Salinisphaera hydrothermalis C41B8]|uniref:FAD-dependent oxidoreductase n=1 Tax=Salinisphaera hydrothermalis (strain C41B8) TaxID=1304275 RepID=A0A084IID4_SALHC|nr:FAD-dependent oxidoreductase [Salinisphaera hydrothermalis C41B8]